MLTLDIFIHVDAINRNAWQGADDDRPLTPLGQQQAVRMADELTAQPVNAIYSSPAVRCQQSLEPLASKTGLPVVVLPTFQDNSAPNAFAALQEMHAALPDGRAVLCSYGDIVPTLLAFLAESWETQAPARDNRKGAVFTVQYDGTRGTLEARAPSADFPG